MKKVGVKSLLVLVRDILVVWIQMQQTITQMHMKMMGVVNMVINIEIKIFFEIPKIIVTTPKKATAINKII